MSYTNKVKAELAAVAPVCAQCESAEAQGLLLPCIDLAHRRILLTTSSVHAAKRFALLVENCFGVSPAISKGKASYLSKVESDSDRIFSAMGVTAKTLAVRIDRALLEADCCTDAFLRGMFLSCGRMQLPADGYRLEFATPHRQLSAQLEALLHEQEHTPIYSLRRGWHILYFKSASYVSALLSRMGATNAANDVLRVREQRKIASTVNRQTNSLFANLTRSAEASAVQNEALRRLASHRLNALPDPLQQAARLRLAHPEASLRELAALSGGVSPSTMARRLNKLVALADEDLSD